MTKMQKMFSLDEEVVHWLKNEANASALVNQLLQAHFKIIQATNGLHPKQALADAEKAHREAEIESNVLQAKLKALQDEAAKEASQWQRL